MLKVLSLTYEWWLHSPNLDRGSLLTLLVCSFHRHPWNSIQYHRAINMSKWVSNSLIYIYKWKTVGKVWAVVGLCSVAKQWPKVFIEEWQWQLISLSKRFIPFFSGYNGRTKLFWRHDRVKISSWFQTHHKRKYLIICNKKINYLSKLSVS